MDRKGTSALIHGVRTLFESGAIGQQTDGELLRRFRECHEPAEAAFDVLLERHGPMVLPVCRSMLRDEHDAQDAFQATFLILVRRPARCEIENRSEAGFTASRYEWRPVARASFARRRKHERRAAERTAFGRGRRCGSSRDHGDHRRRAWPFARPLPRGAASVPPRRSDVRGRRLPVGLANWYGQEPLVARAGIVAAPDSSGVDWGRMTLRTGGSRTARRCRRHCRVTRFRRCSSLLARDRSPNWFLREYFTTQQSLERHANHSGSAHPLTPDSRGDCRRRRRIRIAGAGIVTARYGGSGDCEGRRAPAKQAEARKSKEILFVHVVDTSGRGVPNVEVEFDRDAGEEVGRFRTGPGGWLTVPVDASFSQIVFEARPDAQTLGWASIRSGELNPTGREDDPVNMVLLPGNHRVEGSIVDVRGKPIPGATVQVLQLNHDVNRSGTGYGQVSAESAVGSALTDQAGRYAITTAAGHQRPSFPYITPGMSGRILGVSPKIARSSRLPCATPVESRAP